MAVFADTAQEEVDAACGDDLTLVLLALLLQIGGVAVEDVDVRGRHVDMVEEMPAHEGVYSSILNVTTLRNDTSPASYRRTSSL